MPYHIKKTFPLEPNTILYFEGGNRWSDDYSKRKTYVNKGNADNKIKNDDGKNGGLTNSTVVEE